MQKVTAEDYGNWSCPTFTVTLWLGEGGWQGSHSDMTVNGTCCPIKTSHGAPGWGRWSAWLLGHADTISGPFLLAGASLFCVALKITPQALMLFQCLASRGWTQTFSASTKPPSLASISCYSQCSYYKGINVRNISTLLTSYQACISNE